VGDGRALDVSPVLRVVCRGRLKRQEEDVPVPAAQAAQVLAIMEAGCEGECEDGERRCSGNGQYL